MDGKGRLRPGARLASAFTDEAPARLEGNRIGGRSFGGTGRLPRDGRNRDRAQGTTEAQKDTPRYWGQSRIERLVTNVAPITHPPSAPEPRELVRGVAGHGHTTKGTPQQSPLPPDTQFALARSEPEYPHPPLRKRVGKHLAPFSPIGCQLRFGEQAAVQHLG